MKNEIEWFANEMEKVLQKNDYEPKWRDKSLEYLILKLKEKSNKLEFLLEHYIKSSFTKLEIIKETIDIANLSMMIANITKDY